MKIISFQLTMPNVGSWNGKWTGSESKYYVVKKVSDKYFNSKDHFKDLAEKGRDNWHYSWGDGWGANVTAEIVDSKEAAKRRKLSKGFCGYEWMVDSIMFYGEISTKTERRAIL